MCPVLVHRTGRRQALRLYLLSQSLDQVRVAYDEVASEYATRISDELAGKPLDRALLDVFAQHVDAGPRVCDGET